MSYTKANYEDVEPRAPGMHFLREALDCENQGVTVIDADADWTGMEHDHADQDHEEVYVLVEGAGTLTVEGEDIVLDPGDAVRVAPTASRVLTFHESSTMVAVGAP